MNNPLFGMMNPQQGGFMQKFQQFQQMFRGDPKQQIQQMMNSGKITQQQYNNAVQTAQQFMRMLNGK